jgi:hypothetical protein
MSTNQACVVFGNIATWSKWLSDAMLESICPECSGVTRPPPVSAL